MSVFRPDWLPPLKNAKGQAYYIEHSPQDAVCPYAMAEQAKTMLAAHGAKTEFATYTGGHGFHGAVFPRIKRAIQWMEEQCP